MEINLNVDKINYYLNRINNKKVLIKLWIKVVQLLSTKYPKNSTINNYNNYKLVFDILNSKLNRISQSFWFSSLNFDKYLSIF